MTHGLRPVGLRLVIWSLDLSASSEPNRLSSSEDAYDLYVSLSCLGLLFRDLFFKKQCFQWLKNIGCILSYVALWAIFRVGGMFTPLKSKSLSERNLSSLWRMFVTLWRMHITHAAIELPQGHIFWSVFGQKLRQRNVVIVIYKSILDVIFQSKHIYCRMLVHQAHKVIVHASKRLREAVSSFQLPR